MTVEDYVHKELLTGNRGGFAKALAEAWCVADSNNRFALEESFPNVFRPKIYRKVNVTFDLLYEQDSNLAGKDDEELLAWFREYLVRGVIRNVTLLKGEQP